jgi:hypothetical protein
MNPSLPQEVVDRAIERDPHAAAAEYLAEFRRDIESFVPLEAVQACVISGVRERAPRPGVTYSAFADPSGGSADSFALAIGHVESSDLVVVDALLEIKAPFSPENAVRELSALLKSYRISSICGDRYAGEWLKEQFAHFSILYEPSPKPKSQLYIDLLPLINSERIALLDYPPLVNQLTSLERRTARGGRDSIDHPPRGHDDLANAVAGLAAINNQYAGYDHEYKGFVDPDDTPRPPRRHPIFTEADFERIRRPPAMIPER